MARGKNIQTNLDDQQNILNRVDYSSDQGVRENSLFDDKAPSKKNKISKTELNKSIMKLDEKLSTLSSVVGEEELMFSQTEDLKSFEEETQIQYDEDIQQYNSLLGELNEAVKSLSQKRVKLFKKVPSSKIKS
ncbi:MAG TPA: hypothetical protein PKH65_04405 [Bacteroidia bacterium]|nr:hypothetical protein [Bacteroidia bacterium]HNT79901.1 hypothetical protein [Bacteroidia bacterium]